MAEDLLKRKLLYIQLSDEEKTTTHFHSFLTVAMGPGARGWNPLLGSFKVGIKIRLGQVSLI